MTFVDQSDSSIVAMKICLNYFDIFGDVKLVILSKGQSVTYKSWCNRSLVISILQHFYWSCRVIVNLVNIVIIVPMTREIFILEFFKLIFCILWPDLICQECHLFLNVNTNELFGSKYLPNYLVLIQVVKEDCRIPVLVTSIVFSLLLSAMIFLLQICCEHKSLTLVTIWGANLTTKSYFHSINDCRIWKLFLLIILFRVKIIDE